MVGMMMQMMDLRTGIINVLLQKIGCDPVNFFGNVKLFRHVYVWSGLWQTAGYSSVIYIAALSGVSPELQEAAIDVSYTHLDVYKRQAGYIRTIRTSFLLIWARTRSCRTAWIPFLK